MFKNETLTRFSVDTEELPYSAYDELDAVNDLIERNTILELYRQRDV